MRLKFFLALYLLSLSLFLPASAAAYVDLAVESKANGINMYWDPLSQNCVLEKDGHQVSFHSGAKFVLRDFNAIVQQEAPVLKDGKLVATASFFNEAKTFFSNKKDAKENMDLSIPESYLVGTILIDPGHGGKDPGVVRTYDGKTVTEKDVNLTISLKIYESLKKMFPKKNIVITRTTDRFIELDDRSEIANEICRRGQDAVLFISVHANSAFDSRVSGFEVYYLDPKIRRNVIEIGQEDKEIAPILNSMMEEEFTTESVMLGKYICDGLEKQVGKDSENRGYRAKDLAVCRNSKMPSVLIETGYVSNKEEALRLIDDAYLDKISSGVCNGVQSFVNFYEVSRGFTGR